MDERTSERVAEYLHDMLDAFTRGRFRDFTARIAMPMVIYSEGSKILVAPDREEAALLLAAGWLDICGAAQRFEFEIVSIGCTSNGEFPVRVDWRYLDRRGQERKVSRVRYIMGEGEDGALRLHLVEVFGPSWVRQIEMPVGRYA